MEVLRKEMEWDCVLKKLINCQYRKWENQILTNFSNFQKKNDSNIF